jgi:hypothetical protein
VPLQKLNPGSQATGFRGFCLNRSWSLGRKAAAMGGWDIDWPAFSLPAVQNHQSVFENAAAIGL